MLTGQHREEVGEGLARPEHQCPVRLSWPQAGASAGKIVHPFWIPEPLGTRNSGPGTLVVICGLWQPLSVPTPFRAPSEVPSGL